MHASHLIILLVYLIVIRQSLRLSEWHRYFVLALANISAIVLIFYWPHRKDLIIRELGFYVAVVSLQFWIIQKLVFRQRFSWFPLLIPVIALVTMKYITKNPFLFIGVSYMAFRLSYIGLEIRNKIVPMPSYFQFLSYAFFLPTILIGPISRYNTFYRSLAKPALQGFPVRICLERIIVGAAKYYFLGNVINMLSFNGLILDRNYHPVGDLFVAASATYLFLYCNFSGFCDMVVGFSGLMGIRVDENFNNPFLARNVKEFWNRWHITLSTYLRDMLFSPLSKILVSVFGVSFSEHAIAIAIFVVFIVVGVWHGVGWHFFFLGLAHALAVVANHYYTIFLKYKLGKEGFKAYVENPWIRRMAITFTFIYVSMTFIFFNIEIEGVKRIFEAIR